MPAKHTCSAPGCNEPRASSANYCKEHWCAYTRARRRTERDRVFRQGIAWSIKVLTERVGSDQTTGTQAARLLRLLGLDGNCPVQAPRPRAFFAPPNPAKANGAPPLPALDSPRRPLQNDLRAP
jgi:hypothetical protein